MCSASGSLAHRLAQANRLRYMEPLVALRQREASNVVRGGVEMLDVIFITLVVVFFTLAFWYVRFCERV